MTVLALASVQVWPCALYKVCGQTAARSRMGCADVSGSTPVPGALGLRVGVLSLLGCWECVWL